MGLSINTGIVTLRAWTTTKKKSTLETHCWCSSSTFTTYLHIEMTKVLLLQDEYHLQELEHKKVEL